MDVRSPIESSRATIALSVAFNSTYSHFSVGLTSGYRVYDSATCKAESSYDSRHGFSIVQMLGVTNMIALVAGSGSPVSSPKKVVIWNDAKSESATEISCLSTVRGVRILPDRVVVVLKTEVRIYRLKKVPELLAKYPTADNPYGLCCVSDKLIAFPGRTRGQVQLVDLRTENVTIILAHSSALRAFTFSRDGALLATAGETGTLVRVWSTTTNARLVELRRGADSATIFSLGFSPSGRMLACTSDKGTLHIYDVPYSPATAAPEPAAGGQQAQATTEASRRDSWGQASDLSAEDMGGGGDGTTASNKGRWGILGKLPFMPQYFRDEVSFASAEFAVDDDLASRHLVAQEAAALDLPRLPKGIIGWISDERLVVVGAGTDPRYERFLVRQNMEGTRVCVREGWVSYLG